MNNDPDSPRPGDAYEAVFTEQVRSALVDALGRAYSTATDLHEPARGSNERTFGYGLYEYAVHELGVQAEELGDAVQVLTRHPSFRLGIGEYEVACHRVGRSEHDCIWSCFPNSESAAHTMHEEQLWLPGMSKHLGVESARRVVLAHLGNTEDGFRAAYVCIPWRTEGTRIVEWAHADCIWRVEDDAIVVATDAQPRAPEEVVEEPVVRRKVKQVPDHEEG